MKANQYRKLIITNERGNNNRDHISTWLNTQAVFLNISMERIGLLEQVIHFTKPSRHPVHRSTHVTFISTISDKLIVSCPLKSTKDCSMYKSQYLVMSPSRAGSSHSSSWKIFSFAWLMTFSVQLENQKIGFFHKSNLFPYFPCIVWEISAQTHL